MEPDKNFNSKKKLKNVSVNREKIAKRDEII